MIGVYLSILILFLVLVYLLAYLYLTNRLIYIFNWKSLFRSLNKLQKWLLSGSLIAVFTLGFFTDWVSSFTYGYIFPSPDKKIMENTEIIIEKQNISNRIITESSEKLNKLLNNSKIDSRDIEQYLKELPINKGLVETESIINEWYQKRKISSDEKELLFVVVSVIFEHNKFLSTEITNLKLKGKTDVAEFLENIQKYLLEGDASKIESEYFSRKEKLKRENIIILKQSIAATKALFAIKETKELYKELISLEPTADNYFRFAYFSLNLRYFADASTYFFEALKIYRGLAKDNPRTYLPFVATTLNNFAILHATINEYPQALEKYVEALKIYRELAKENPRTYLPYVASILNNIAILHQIKNEYSQSLEKYVEAFNIYRELAKKNPRTYLPDVAMTLNNLAVLRLTKNEFLEAQKNFELALNIYRELDNQRPNTYLLGIAWTLGNLAAILADKNEFPQATEKIEEALKIYRELAKKNPRTYLPSLANTLNNFVSIHVSMNEFPQALANYEEALKIHRELAKEDPSVYEIDYAKTLIIGVELLKKNIHGLKEAKNILEKYPEDSRSQILLEKIKGLE